MNYKTLVIEVDVESEGLYDDLLLEKKNLNNSKEIREWIEEEVNMGNYKIIKVKDWLWLWSKLRRLGFT